jgi:hypothetical protein
MGHRCSRSIEALGSPTDRPQDRLGFSAFICLYSCVQGYFAKRPKFDEGHDRSDVRTSSQANDNCIPSRAMTGRGARA